MYKLLKVIILWPLTILLIAVVILICLSYLFQSRIERAALDQLLSLTNNQLSYEDAQLDYFSSFPSITLDLIQPRLYDLDYNEAINLEEFQAELNMFQAIFSKPSISHLLIKNGSVRLTERNQSWNVQDMIMSDEEGSGRNTMIDIESITIENFKILIDRGTPREQYDLLMTDATMKLLQSGDELKIETDGRISLETVTRDNKVQTIAYEDRVSLTLNYGIESKLLDIKKCVFDNGIDINGSFNTINSQRDILIKVKDFPLKKLNPIFKHLDESKYGQISMKGTAVSQIHMDDIDALDYNISVNKGSILYRDGGDHEVNLKAIAMSITGSEKVLKVKNLSGKIDGKPVEGTADINLLKHRINALEVKGALPVKSIHPFISNSSITDAKGVINIDRFILTDFALDQPKQNLLEYIDVSATTEKLQFRLSDKPWVTMQDGHFHSEGSQILFDNVAISFSDSDLLLNGRFNTKESEPYFQLELKSERLVIDSLLTYLSSADTSAAEPLTHHLFEIDINVDKAMYGEVLLESLVADISSKGKGIQIATISDAFDGAVSSEGLMTYENGLYHYATKTDIEDVNFSECLRQSENFGQSFITDQNIKGMVNSLGLYHFYWDKDWNIQSDKSRGLISLNVKDGELVGLDILKQFSSFVNVKDLDKVKFIELDNYLEIKGKSVYIPTMFIQSNAANFTMSGHHSTDNVQLYYLQVNAGQILMDKFKRHNSGLKPKPAKQRGWFNLYYVVDSDGQNYNYKKDRSRVQAAFSNGLLRKEQIYRKLIDEFGYSDKLKLPSDWSKIPEYNLEDE